MTLEELQNRLRRLHEASLSLARELDNLLRITQGKEPRAPASAPYPPPGIKPGDNGWEYLGTGMGNVKGICGGTKFIVHGKGTLEGCGGPLYVRQMDHYVKDGEIWCPRCGIRYTENGRARDDGWGYPEALPPPVLKQDGEVA